MFFHRLRALSRRKRMIAITTTIPAKFITISSKPSPLYYSKRKYVLCTLTHDTGGLPPYSDLCCHEFLPLCDHKTAWTHTVAPPAHFLVSLQPRHNTMQPATGAFGTANIAPPGAHEGR